MAWVLASGDARRVEMRQDRILLQRALRRVSLREFRMRPRYGRVAIKPFFVSTHRYLRVSAGAPRLTTLRSR